MIIEINITRDSFCPAAVLYAHSRDPSCPTHRENGMLVVSFSEIDSDKTFHKGAEPKLTVKTNSMILQSNPSLLFSLM